MNCQSTTPGATSTPKTENTYHLPQLPGRISSQVECISAAELRAISDHTYPPQEGRAQLSQFGKTDGFHLRSRCGRLVLANGKLVSALTFIIMLAMPTSVTNATKSNNS